MHGTHASHRKAPRHRLTPNLKKILEAVLFIISKAKDRNLRVTQYDIVKTVFLADRAHLNRYGRPVTFDIYYALRHGPVPTNTYNLLKETEATMRKFGLAKPLWLRTPAPDISNKAFVFSNPVRGFDEDILSQTDLVALVDAQSIVDGLTFGQLKNLTHEDPAYKEAWDTEGDEEAYEMSLGLLFEGGDFEQAENLAYASEHLSVAAE